MALLTPEQHAREASEFPKLARRVEAIGLTLKRYRGGHWQARGSRVIVDYWPFSRRLAARMEKPIKHNFADVKNADEFIAVCMAAADMVLEEMRNKPIKR